jgi:hypothetical protein
MKRILLSLSALALVVTLFLSSTMPTGAAVFQKSGTPFLYDADTGYVVGFKDSDGTETYFPRFSTQALASNVAAFVPTVAAITSGTINGATIGAVTPSTVRSTTLTATGTVSLSPANAAVTISPTGTGTVAISPATAGTMDKMAIGGTTPAAGAFTTLTASSTMIATSFVSAQPAGSGIGYKHGGWDIVGDNGFAVRFGGQTNGQFRSVELWANSTGNVAGKVVDVSNGTVAVTGVLTLSGDTMRIATAKTPATAAEACTTGTVAWDTGFIYVCTATDTWKRVAIATW